MTGSPLSTSIASTLPVTGERMSIRLLPSANVNSNSPSCTESLN